ncbi:MAG: DnaJ domain-containing protein [Candidatus Rokubacteria bacterium]|nr:DnaJ domain-containing protein [Candidatus Rokubacteria bacterium]
MEYKDYYKILGDQTIKQAYRRLARKHHPDVSKAKGSADRFKEINEAYEVLSDPEKRKRYDSLGSDWQRYAQAGSGPFGGFRVHFEGTDPGDLGGFSDFFRTIFGDLGVREGDPFAEFRKEGRRPGFRSARGGDTQAAVEVSLEEAFGGSTRTFTVDGRRLEVKIPAGVDTGSRVRVPGVGNGDLYLTVTVRSHPLFERKGDDLYLEVPLTIAEAALGTEVRVPTLKGDVTMKIPPETSSGKTFRLPAYGMPHLKGGGAGDQYVKIKVVVPSGLTAREKALLEELRRLRPENPRAHMAPS